MAAAAFRTWKMPCGMLRNAVDLSGIARAVYEIDYQTDKDADDRAEKFLDAHPIVEVWDGPAGEEVSDRSTCSACSLVKLAAQAVPINAGPCVLDRRPIQPLHAPNARRPVRTIKSFCGLQPLFRGVVALPVLHQAATLNHLVAKHSEHAGWLPLG